MLKHDMTRKTQLEALLQPCTWELSSSVETRRNIVIERHKAIRIAYPFFTDEEKKLADEWFESEAHQGLWD
jgi:hypothetical protein